MAGSPRIVTEDRQISWDGVTQRLPKGQVLDVPPGSALEREIGREYLVPLGAVTPPQAEAPASAEEAAPAEKPAPKEEPKAAAPKPAPVKAKAQDDAKDGEP